MYLNVIYLHEVYVLCVYVYAGIYGCGGGYGSGGGGKRGYDIACEEYWFCL